VAFAMSPARWDAVHDWAGGLIRKFMLDHHDPTVASVLDVGAGWGKYRELLPEFNGIDAVEVWPATVVAEELGGRYRRVFVDDICDFVQSSYLDDGSYNAIILADVLEHLDVAGAQLVLEKVCHRNVDVLVVVPYLYEQHEEDGNPYQVHVQDDLTPDLMRSRYPQLELVAVETRDWKAFKGLYIRPACRPMIQGVEDGDRDETENDDK
jgi:hypothetical protein